MRFALVVSAICCLSAQAVAQQNLGMPPRAMSLAPHMRGFPKHGELIGAAVACGLRTQTWAETYRTKLYQAVAASHRIGLDVADTMNMIAETEAYAQRSQKRNAREYCPWIANPSALLAGDLIVQGRERIEPAR